jgi:hypothetical protein
LRECDVYIACRFELGEFGTLQRVKHRGPTSLAHTPDWGVLLAVLGALLVIAMLLEACWTVVRWQMEDQDLDAVVPQLLLTFMGAALVVAGVVLVRRRWRRLSGRVMKTSLDGPS